MNCYKEKNKYSIGDLVWIPQNTEVQKTYRWMNGLGYYPGDYTDYPLEGVVIDSFYDALDTEYVAMAVIWKEHKIVCRLEDVFPIKEEK